MTNIPIFCAIDTSDIDKALELVSQISPHVGGVKLGLEFFTSCGLLGLEKIKELSDFMENLGMHKYKEVDGEYEVGWFDFEHEKIRRMTDMTINSDEWLNKQRKDFVLFIDEYDKRREKNFLKTFPEMEDFYNSCKKII